MTQSLDNIIETVIAPIREVTFSWLENVAETMAEDFPAIGPYGGIIKLANFGSTVLNASSDAEAGNQIPAIGVDSGGFLLGGAVGGVLIAAEAPFAAIAAYTLAFSWIGSKLTSALYGTISQYAPTIYNELQTDVAVLGNAASSYLATISSDVGSIISQSQQSILNLPTNSPNYVSQISAIVDSAIENGITSVANDTGQFLSGIGVTSPQSILSEMTQGDASVENWISGAENALSTDTSASESYLLISPC
jgi:hypothetical protein